MSFFAREELADFMFVEMRCVHEECESLRYKRGDAAQALATTEDIFLGDHLKQAEVIVTVLTACLVALLPRRSVVTPL
jgi:hypothetical protein